MKITFSRGRKRVMRSGSKTYCIVKQWLSVVVCACNPIVGEAEAGGSLGFTGQLAWPSISKLQASERFCLKRKVNCVLGLTLDVDLWLPHACTCTHVWARTHTHVYIR